MQFYEYWDNYRVARNDPMHHLHLEAKNTTAQEFYTGMIFNQASERLAYERQGLQEPADGTEQFIANLLGELDWINNSRPYVKIFPKMAHMLSKIKLNVPWSILKMPYSSFEIRLPSDPEHQFREALDKPPIQSIFINLVMDAKNHPRDKVTLSCLDSQNRKKIFATPILVPTVPKKRTYLNIVYMGGEKKVQDYFIWVNMSDKATIEETLNDIAKRPPIDWSVLSKVPNAIEYRPSPNFYNKIVSLVIATCLLINGEHEEVLPDLPKKLLPRYEQSKTMSPQDRAKVNEELMEKSKKLNHNGVTIGKKYEVEIPRPQYERHENEEPTGRTHELTYRQYRSPHPRLQPYGPRDNPEYKIIIIPFTTVRPDLPPRPVVNYKVTDRSLDLENPNEPEETT